MTKCTVKFEHDGVGPSAVLYDAHGHSVNLINYPRGTRLTSKEKTRARKLLMRGCRELSRPRSRGVFGDVLSALGRMLAPSRGRA